jgi:hypothetical protein
LNWRLSRIKHALVDKLNLYRIDHYPIGTSRQRGSFTPNYGNVRTGLARLEWQQATFSVPRALFKHQLMTT